MKANIINTISRTCHCSPNTAKAAVMLQTYRFADDVKFWCSNNAPLPDEDAMEDMDEREYEEALTNVPKENWIAIFDAMDHRFDGWCTPPKKLIDRMRNKHGN